MNVKFDPVLARLRTNDPAEDGSSEAMQITYDAILGKMREQVSVQGDAVLYDAVLGKLRSRVVADAESEPFVYGVLHDPNAPSPLVQQVIYSRGAVLAVEAFDALPAHNWKRCVLDNLSTRHVNYYLDPIDSTKKLDGSAADLSGADGDVMVEMPIVHWRLETLDDGRILYLVSEEPFDGSSIHPLFYVSPGGATARTQYVGAYRSVGCNAAGTPLIATQDAGDTATLDDTCRARSVAGGKPYTYTASALSRTMAANSGGSIVNFQFHCFLQMMMLIEMGSFNAQDALSSGFSFANGWNYAYVRFTGRANFGNGTGTIYADPIQDSLIPWRNGTTEAQKVVQFSYRGIENPYGELNEWADGLQKYQESADGVITYGNYWWTLDCDAYTDLQQQGAASPVYSMTEHLWPLAATGGWIKSWAPDTFFPTAVGGSNSTYMCDQITNPVTAGRRIPIRGGIMTGTLGNGPGFMNVGEGSARTLYGATRLMA